MLLLCNSLAAKATRMEALLEGMQRNEQGSGGFLTSCEAELQELMKQIDIMVAHKKSEWEEQTQALETCLSIQEQELSSVRAALHEKNKEVAMLHHQLEDVERARQEMVREYEQQLKKFQEELSRLRRSYEKLQKKHLREARGEASKRQGENGFEMSQLTRKLEEFRQKSLDWEKQRLLYQQQVASLEAQREALTKQSELLQTQLANQKQLLESVELASRSEIQHLTSRLERANGTICANELEVERLHMRVDDLTESNRMILEDQQRVQEELRQSKKMLEVLQDEKMELRATLQSQEDFSDSSKLHQEQLQKELARVTESLLTKEVLIRALEDRLREKQLSSPGLELEHALLQLQNAQKKEQHLQSEVTHLENRLVSSNALCVQLSEELDASIRELQSVEEHHTESKAEIKKLKEQLSRAEQTHSSELEGMKREISRLTHELLQRDISITSTSITTSYLEQRLRTELGEAERKAVEHRGKDVTLRAHGEDAAIALNKLKSENWQLRKDLAEARAKLELSQQDCQDGPERPAPLMQDREPEARDVQCRTTREAQLKCDEHHKPDGTLQHHPGEPQRCGAAEMETVTSEKGEQPTQTSRKNCSESFALGALLGMDSVLHVLDNDRGFADEASKQSPANNQRESVPLSPLPTASVGSIAARYLEEEELRSQHVLESLNAHIEELKRESAKIVRKFGHCEQNVSYGT
ncbi:centrosomal protein of 63 kDa isoform X4 [Cuculus canorus]|uniref:centrosomal protein of 63 kDa isoform X4 n=4 Tax=Cuculus canorus TaxID=55661 RepID=UPI0023AA46B5|nr:centrosomal protein of 63 kDa isoform X4 [Cuculus canorus]